MNPRPLVLLALVAFAGCAGPTGPETIEWESVEGCTVEEEGQGRIRTVAALVTFFEDHCDADAPDVDLDRQAVVWHAMGQQSTAGYAVEIMAAERDGDNMQVDFLEIAPGAGCSTAQVITYPTGVFILSAAADSIQLRENTTTRSCT